MEEGVCGAEAYDLRGEAVEEFGGAMAVVLGEACNGDREVQLVVDDLSGYLHLSFASIDHEQVGQGLPLVGKALVAAIDDFGHGGIVVGAFDGLDVETAVLLAVGLAVGETHHACYGIGALDVGIVETLNVDGQRGEVECMLYALEEVGGATGAVFLGGFGVNERALVAALVLIGADVAEGEFEEFLAIALRGDGLLDVGLGEVIDVHGDYGFLGGAVGALVQFGNDGGKDVGVALVELLLYLVGETVDDAAVLDAHHVDVGVAVVGENGKDIDVLDLGVHHGGAALILFEQAYAAAELLGLLEAELVGKGEHLLTEVVEDVAKVAFEYSADVLDGAQVVVAALQADAGGEAKAYLMLHARAVGAAEHAGSGWVVAQTEGAGAIGKELAYDVLQGTHDGLVGIGAEILAFEGVAASENEAGEIFLRDAEVGVGLVVLEHAVVAGLVALDEVVFEQEGVNLSGYDGDTDVVDVAHEHLDFGALVVVVGEIGTDAALKVASLANINDIPRSIEVLIDTGIFGDGFEAQEYALYVGIDAGVYHSGYTSLARSMRNCALWMPGRS